MKHRTGASVESFSYRCANGNTIVVDCWCDRQRMPSDIVVQNIILSKLSAFVHRSGAAFSCGRRLNESRSSVKFGNDTRAIPARILLTFCEPFVTIFVKTSFCVDGHSPNITVMIFCRCWFLSSPNRNIFNSWWWARRGERDKESEAKGKIIHSFHGASFLYK